MGEGKHIEKKISLHKRLHSLGAVPQSRAKSKRSLGLKKRVDEILGRCI